MVVAYTGQLQFKKRVTWWRPAGGGGGGGEGAASLCSSGSQFVGFFFSDSWRYILVVGSTPPSFFLFIAVSLSISKSNGWKLYEQTSGRVDG